MIKGTIKPELYALKNLLYTTCLIETFDKDDNDEGTGTGFFYHVLDSDEHRQDYYIELLITNKHVVRGAQKGRLHFHLGPVVDGFPTGGTHTLEIDNFESQFINHSDPDIDLCALNLSTYLSKIRSSIGKDVHYQAFTSVVIPSDDDLKQMFPITDVYMIGYPIGLWDQTNNLPIARRGGTASHPYFDFNAKSEGAIDIATFEGSSGSPIISYEYGSPTYDEPFPIEFRLLGILWGGETVSVDGKLVTVAIPTKKQMVPRVDLMLHLGYYIKAKELF